MRDIVRLKTSLSEEIESVLNEQIKMEAWASASYLSMAGYCDRNGFDNSANFFYRQSHEEREHMLKIFRYIQDSGGTAISPEVSNIRHDYNSFREVFEVSLEQEIAVTQNFNRIVDLCHRLKDFTTSHFLEWFLKEQIEEEYIARRALELFNVIGEEGVGRYMIDKKIPEIKYDPS